MLATDVRNIPDRHRSIQAVFDSSWNRLSDVEQDALMRLSVFRGGWQAAEALRVAKADLLLLRRLVDKSLVRAGENGRYDLHELIRQYAARKLSESGDETKTRQQHFDSYLALAAQLDAQQYSPQGREAFARFDQEQDNFRAALAWSLEGERAEMSLRLLYHLWFYWFHRGYSGEGERWTTRAIAHAGEVESALLCLALNWAFAFIFNQGRYSEAIPYLARLLPMARRLEDAEALVMALMAESWGSVNSQQALNRLDEAIAIIQETDRLQHLLPLFYYTAGIWLQRSGRYDEARDYYQRSLDHYRQMGAVHMTADSLGLLGQLALQDGCLQEAYDLTAESVAVARDGGRQVVFGDWGGVRLGLIQLYLGNLEAAERTLQAALRLLEGVTHDMRGQQEALSYLSEVALARGDVTSAADYLQASLNICRILYHQLQATHKLEGTPDALPIELIGMCARAALVAAAQGHYERAVTLNGIADSLRVQSTQVMLPPLQARLDEVMTAARVHLSESAFSIAWKTGQTMSLTEAFAFLLT
jgi:tetratricopeptide (TPR) repeat protein